MSINGVTEIPSGLIRPLHRSQTIENIELRATLEKAVEDAGLNVSERMALNHKFFPSGGGFELFPKDVAVPEFTHFYNGSKADFEDEFTREVSEIEIPDDCGIYIEQGRKSPKGNFQTNLDNALKKLANVLKRDV